MSFITLMYFLNSIQISNDAYFKTERVQMNHEVAFLEDESLYFNGV